MTAVKKTGDHTYEVESRTRMDQTVAIEAGGLGDNIVIRDGGFHFSLALASIEAIVRDAGLTTSGRIEVDARPVWHDAMVVRATYRGYRGLFMRTLADGWVPQWNKDTSRGYISSHAEKNFTDVEVVVGADG